MLYLLLRISPRDGNDVSEKGAKCGCYLWKIDVGRLVGGIVGVREGEHVPEDR